MLCTEPECHAEAFVSGFDHLRRQTPCGASQVRAATRKRHPLRKPSYASPAHGSHPTQASRPKLEGRLPHEVDAALTTSQSHAGSRHNGSAFSCEPQRLRASPETPGVAAKYYHGPITDSCGSSAATPGCAANALLHGRLRNGSWVEWAGVPPSFSLGPSLDARR